MKIEARMASDKYEKASVVKGHHVYKSIWTPVIGQELQVKPEDDNESNTTNTPFLLSWAIAQ